MDSQSRDSDVRGLEPLPVYWFYHRHSTVELNALSRPEESCAPGSLDEIVCYGYSLPEMEELMDGGVSLLVAEASIG